MGGFTINGCGAADSFYTMKSLGTHFCYHCNKEKEFALMEVKRKIVVAFIPTFSISTKYAVACKKCKLGYYVDDTLKDDLYNGRKKIEVMRDRIEYIDTKSEHMAFNAVEGKTAARIQESQTTASFCKCCGATLKDGQLFCSNCGVKIV